MSFKVGDTVEIIFNTCYHGFEIGEKVKILETSEDGLVYEGADQFGTTWSFTDSDINCVGEQMIKYEVGDIVEVIDRITGHEFDIGEKIRVRSLLNDGTINSCEYLDKSDYWFLDNEEVRHVQGELQ